MQCADTRCCCCAVCSDVNGFGSAADSMSASTMVGEQIDNSTISADASLKATLSLAAVCVDCMVHPAALMQEKCRDCGTWTKRRSDRTHRCNDCARSHRQQLQQKAAAAAAAAAPSSSPAPPPPRFDHDPHSHSHLSQEQRITIRILRKEGLEVSAIAARIPCHVDTVCDRAIGYADKVRCSVSTGWLCLYDQYVASEREVPSERRERKIR